MEFQNENASILQRYLSAKKNFSNTLWYLGKNADTSAMRWKGRLQYRLIMHQNILLYGGCLLLSNILKKYCKNKNREFMEKRSLIYIKNKVLNFLMF